MNQPFLVGKILYLRGLEQKDLAGNYFDWLNDYQVTKYLESGRFPNTPERMQQFFQSVGNSNDNALFAVVDKQTDKHIGNIRLGPISWIHRTTQLGIMIGDKGFWGKGYATEAIGLVVRYAFTRLNLNKISAGIIEPNRGSAKAYEKVGFAVEGNLKEAYFVDGRYENAILVGLTRQDFDIRLKQPQLSRQPVQSASR